jgi:hypothetical protein
VDRELEQTCEGTVMNRLTLEWIEKDQLTSFTVTDQMPTKQSGVVRIGRDPLRCDLLLTHPTVSGLHVEIFYQPQQATFYIRSLRPSNPPLLNQRPILDTTEPLREGDRLHLGLVQLDVRAIALDPILPTILKPPAPLPETDHLPTAPLNPMAATVPAYGLQCPKCSQVSPYERLQAGCPWCGASLASAESILIKPDF